MALPSENTQRYFRQSFPNEAQLWPEFAEDVISDVIPGDSPLIAWLPKRAVNTWNIDIHHLIGVWGKDFDGSQTYMEYITDNFTVDSDPPECDWGVGGMDFARYSYKYELNRISVSHADDPLNIFDGGGMRQYQGQASVPRIRGEFAGQSITNDVELMLAMTGKRLYDHINRTTREGNAAIKSNLGMFDGLETVLTQGWVANHTIGPGGAPYSDPRIIPGTSISKPEDLVNRIEWEFFRTFNRIRSRGREPSGDDIVVIMTDAHWQACAKAISHGSLAYHTNNMSNIQVNVDISAVQREYERITNFNELFAGSNVGFAGFFPLNGYNLPVIVDNNLGQNSINPVNNKPAVTGDVEIVCKRAFGENILELMYLDWTQIPLAQNMPTGPMNSYPTISPLYTENGLVRAKWVPASITNECWYWALDCYMGLGSKMQPLQTRILDVTLETDFANAIESGDWTHPNYYMYGNETGAIGNSLLNASNN